MNYYKVPKTELERKVVPAPREISVVIALLSLSILLALLGSIQSVGFDHWLEYFESEYVVFDVIWITVICWVCSDILSAQSNPRYTLLIFIVILLFFGGVDDGRALSYVFALGESLCFVASFFLLSKKRVLAWFENR